MNETRSLHPPSDRRRRPRGPSGPRERNVPPNCRRPAAVRPPGACPGRRVDETFRPLDSAHPTAPAQAGLGRRGRNVPSSRRPPDGACPDGLGRRGRTVRPSRRPPNGACPGGLGLRGRTASTGRRRPAPRRQRSRRGDVAIALHRAELQRCAAGRVVAGPCSIPSCEAGAARSPECAGPALKPNAREPRDAWGARGSWIQLAEAFLATAARSSRAGAGTWGCRTDPRPAAGWSRGRSAGWRRRPSPRRSSSGWAGATWS